MSSLPQRRDSPRRRRISGSRMHPGWACFLCALGAGFFGAMACLASIQWAMLKLQFGWWPG
jgi:hypothetical protein